MRKFTPHSFRLASLAMILCLLTALLISAVPKAFAATKIGTRFLRLSTSLASIEATHLIGITYLDTTNVVGSVELEYCVNDPLPGTPCTVPSGLDLTNAVLSNQSGEVDFTIHPNSTANRLILSRPAVAPSTPNSIYQLDSVMNPDTRGSYYVRIQTYSSEDATGVSIEQGGMVFAITRALSISTEVPPYLLLCTGVTITGFDCSSATSFLINMGELQTSQTSRGQSEMVVATNAGYGYSITIAGTTLTSGNNVVDALTIPTASSPGVSQYGVNLRANTNPAIGAEPVGAGTGVPINGYENPNQFKFNSGDSIITSSTTSTLHKFTVSYITNIDAAQEPGVYATTMSFIALGNF